MADKLTPITRLEGILAGQDIQPITRLEYFLKQYASGSGSGGGGVYVVDCTMNDSKITSTKTAGEIFEAIESKTVVFKLTAGGITAYMPLISASNKSGYMFTVSDGMTGTSLTGMRLRANSADGYPESEIT